MSALDDLARKLGLLQIPSKDAALEWASRCLEFETLLDEIEQFVSQEETTGKIMPTWRAEFFANNGENLPSR